MSRATRITGRFEYDTGRVVKIARVNQFQLMRDCFMTFL